MTPPLADQHDRDLISTALDDTLIVEAAAGTGKTSELVRRIVRVIETGRAEITEIVRLVGKIRPEVVIGSGALLVEDLGIDSLDLVSISMKIEDRFRVEIDVDEVPNFRCVDDLAGYVARQRGAAAA